MSERNEVLANLRDISGQSVEDWSLSSISEPQSLLVVMGRPGAGKTTILNQIFRKIVSTSSEPVGIISFDLVRAGLIEDLGRQPSFWADEDWQELNNLLIAGVQLWTRRGQSVLLECVGVGIKDRGVTALRHEFPDIKKKNILAVIPENLESVIVFRKYVASTKNFQGLKSRIMEIFNIDIGQDFDDTEVSGREIVKMIGETAQEEHLVGIDNEVNKIQVPSWRKSNLSIAHKLIKEIQMDDSKPHSLRTKIKFEAAFIDYLLRSWGFDNESQRVVINWKLYNQTIHM